MRTRLLRTVREATIVASAAALLSAFLPQVLGSGPDPETLAARTACERVKAAIEQFSRDTGTNPNQASGNAGVEWLVGPGAVPFNFSLESTPTLELARLLGEDTVEGLKGYAGPYLMFGGADSWGRSILAHVGAVSAPGRVWVLSAGPNGLLETLPGAEETGGDDVGVLLDLGL
jgi:hypothetical protein